MNSWTLEHFLAAYELHSLGRAADRLGLTQPALSKSIRKLESELGVPLFERSTTGVVPTLFGETLARRGQAIRADIQSTVVELHKLRQGEVGEVRMGVAPALSPHFLPRVLMWLQERYPSLDMVIHEGLYDSLAQEVSRGELDFALTNLPSDAPTFGLQMREVFRDRFVVCCGPNNPLVAQSKVHPADLLAWPWVTPPHHGMAWQRIVDLFAKVGCKPPHAVIQTDSAALITAMLTNGRFLTFVPRQLVIADLARGELIELATQEITVERAIAVVSRPGREQPTAAKLALHACAAIIDEMSQEPGWNGYQPKMD